MEKDKDQKTEIQDIFVCGAPSYLEKFPVNLQQRKAIFSIMYCRGPQLGRHVDKCDRCGYREISYNSCRNRHCPKCQSGKQLIWIKKLEGTLPPVRYFHVVFTLPHELNELVYKYQKDCYPLLFKASAQTLQCVASRPGFLGAQTGCLSILHTWGQNLHYHPHIHMLVPAGGISEDQMEWIPSGKKFFIPVKVLSRVFRGKFIALLEGLISRGIIPADLSELKSQLYKKDWVVYSKKVFSGPGQVLQYLGRYTHRVAISNARIISHNQGNVTFRWKDYRDGACWKIMQLDTLEFIRRYLLHVLPVNFYKIRYYGIFSLAYRNQALARFFVLLRHQYTKSLTGFMGTTKTADRLSFRTCPLCRVGTLRFYAIMPSFFGKGP